MKKHVALLLTCILVLSAVVGCGGKSEFVGSWTQSKINYNGKDMTIKEFADQYGANAALYTMTMTLTDDGKLEGSFMNESFTGTFKEEDGKVTLTINNANYTATLDKGNLVMKKNTYIYTFTKDK